MKSTIEQILDAIMLALTNTTPAGARVFDCLETALENNELPAIVVNPPESEDTHKFSDMADINTTVISVDVLVSGDPWRAQSDAIAVQVHNLLITSATVRPLLHSLRKSGRKWAAKSAEVTYGADQLQYEITYLSMSQDLAQPI